MNPQYNTVPLLLNGGHRALLIVEDSSNDSIQLVLQSLHAQTPYYTPSSTRAITSENTSLSIEGGSSVRAEVYGTLNSHWSRAGVESNSLTLYAKDLHCQPHYSLPPPPSVTELQTVPESPPLPSSLNDSSLPLSVVTAPEGAGEGGKVSEADERVVRASDGSRDASGESANTVSTPPTGQPGVVSTCFNMTQSLQSQCEGREKLTEESDEEIDMPAVDEPLVNPCHLHLGIAPMSSVVETGFQTLPPPLPQVTEVPPHLVSPTEPEPMEAPPLKRARLCSDISQYKLVELESDVGEAEKKEAEEEDGLLATESASDGSSTEDQAVPTECAREHGLVASLAPCNKHWPQGGGGEGGGEGEQEVRGEGYWGDGDEESLCPVTSGAISSQQTDVSLEQQQVVPDGPVATRQMASSLYDQDDGSKCSSLYSVYLGSLPALRMRDQKRPFSGTGIHLTTCCSCNTRGMYAGCGP